MAQIPYRLYVLKKLTDHLKGITPTNGFTVDVSESVYRGIAVFSGDESQWPLPMVSILESVNPDVDGERGGNERQYRMESWSLLVQGWARDDPANPTDPAYQLCAAVESRLGAITAMMTDGSGRPVDPSIYLLGPHPERPSSTLITGFKVSPPVVRPPADQVSSRAFFYLPVQVELAYQAGSPYITI